MRRVSAAEANRQFSKILREVAAGETIIVTSRGKPVAEIRGHLGDAVANQGRNAARAALLQRLDGQPARHLGKFRREDAYD